MKVLAALLALLWFQQSNGCNETPTPQPTPKAEAVAPRCSSTHRFEKTEVYPMNLRADIAMDSCTGQICRTWSWEVKGANPKSPWQTYADAPLCRDLAVSNP